VLKNLRAARLVTLSGPGGVGKTRLATEASRRLDVDNLHAALRWTIARQDADAALRFVRALGWYWMLRGSPASQRRWPARSSRSLRRVRAGTSTRCGRCWPRPWSTSPSGPQTERPPIRSPRWASRCWLFTTATPNAPLPYLIGTPDRRIHGYGRRHVIAADAGPPVVRPEQRGQDAHRCRLAGPVGPEHAEYRALPGHQIHAVQRRRLTKPLDQAGGLNRVSCCRVISHEAIVTHAAVRTRTAICQRPAEPMRVLPAPNDGRRIPRSPRARRVPSAGW
jgi:hypothetical protein